MPKKKKKWAVRPSPGPHSKKESIPLAVALREGLGFSRTKKEADRIINSGKVKVDGKPRRDSGYPVGFMDVLEIPKIEKSWRTLFDKKGYLHFCEIEKDSDSKLAKVIGKSPFKGGKTQISLIDGKNLVGDFDSIKVGDSVKVSLPEIDFKGRIPLEKGSLAFITGGSNVGKRGKIEEVLESSGGSEDHFLIKSDSEEFQSPEKYVFAIGKKEPEILIPEVVG